MSELIVGGIVSYISSHLESLLGGAVLWLVNVLISLLPSTPFLFLGADGVPSQSIAWLNWVVDVGGLADLMAGWLLCVSLYYVAAKVFQAISNIDGIRTAIGAGVVGAITGGGE